MDTWKHNAARKNVQDPVRMSREHFAAIFRIMQGIGLENDYMTVTLWEIAGMTPADTFGDFMDLNAHKVQLFEEGEAA